MRFGLCVRLGVDLHVRLTEEGRRTHPAPTGVETEKWKDGMEVQGGGRRGRCTRGGEKKREKMGQKKIRRQGNGAMTHREK